MRGDIMNLLYLSKSDDLPWSGPTYSIPMQIESQAKYDNVYWLNLKKAKYGQWKVLPFYQEIHGGVFFNLTSILNTFKIPRPDLVILESVYDFRLQLISIVNTLKKEEIPFIFVPRVELTEGAQKYKYWKKRIANYLFVKRMLHKAIAIQYLTKNEMKNSIQLVETPGIVIPNGIDMKQITKKRFEGTGIRFVYVGRLHTYHKGIDLLLKAWMDMRNKMKKHECTLDIYGPDRTGDIAHFKQMVADADMGKIIHFYDAVYGADKEKVLLNGDVFIMTSRMEGQPMGLLEALSYGLPCLVTTGTNMRDEVEKADAGWGCDNSVQSIKDALCKAIYDQKQFPLKGNNAINLSKKYSWHKIAFDAHEQYIKVIGKAINKSIERDS